LNGNATDEATGTMHRVPFFRRIFVSQSMHFYVLLPYFGCISAWLYFLHTIHIYRMIASLKGSNHQISEQERMVRNHEMELLAKISEPPGRDGDRLETLVKHHKENMTEISAKDDT
jgi:hypothetical protein